MSAPRTLVIQSYRNHAVPRWLERCLQSVRTWAQGSGFEYRFVDDSLFEAAPEWYRRRCGTLKLPVTDLARLVLIQRALEHEGYEQALWIDADVLVFHPGRFTVDAPAGYAFARELWLSRDAAGAPVTTLRVNNSITVMGRNNPVLAFMIHACQQIVAHRAPESLTHDAVGTALLSAIAVAMPVPVVRGAGQASPFILLELARGGGEFLPLLARSLPEPLACVNLCGSMVGVPFFGVTLAEADMEAAVERLLDTRGEALNA